MKYLPFCGSAIVMPDSPWYAVQLTFFGTARLMSEHTKTASVNISETAAQHMTGKGSSQCTIYSSMRYAAASLHDVPLVYKIALSVCSHPAAAPQALSLSCGIRAHSLFCIEACRSSDVEAGLSAACSCIIPGDVRLAGSWASSPLVPSHKALSPQQRHAHHLDHERNDTARWGVAP